MWIIQFMSSNIACKQALGSLFEASSNTEMGYKLRYIITVVYNNLHINNVLLGERDTRLV